ncbi:T9SS type A sorting domain-containing protein [Polaribacter sp.]|nr:T9SS type A sorting domain-containing protein [Polaribacter sp.]
MKQFLSLLILSISTFSFSQVISENNPYTKEFALDLKKNASQNTAFKSGNTKPTLERISSQFDAFWKQKDYSKKGSGYKPFKRWEQHWSHYLMEDGSIAPPSVLWDAWREKNALESAKNKTNQSPTSTWTSIGPAVVANTATKTAGQGRVNAIALDPNDPNTIYVGAPAGGIWKSTNNGIDWMPLADNLPQIGVSGIAIDPNNSNVIYISTGDDDAGDSYSIGVLKSLDGGATWNTTGLTFNFNYKGSNEIFIDPTNSSIVWVATSEGLYKTNDAGDNWDVMLEANIRDFRLKPGDPLTIYAVSDYNGTPSKFYKSINGGVQFDEITTVPTNSNRLAIEVTEADPSIVYLLSSYDNGEDTRAGENAFQGLYKSTDSGNSFTKTLEADDIFESSQSWYDMALTVSDTNSDIVFVGVLDIWKSTDGGDNFSQINYWYDHNAQFTHADIHFLRYFNNVLYAGTDGGIYRSANDGAIFEDLSTNLSISQLYTISVSKTSSQKIAGGLQDCGGFAYSNNAWNSYHGGDGMGSAIDPALDDHYYGFTQYGRNLYLNTAGGNTNSTFITGSPEEGEWVAPLQFNKNSELYAGYSQLYNLENGAWNQLSDHEFNGNLDHIEISPVHNNVIYVAQENILFKSIDKGISFTQILNSNGRIMSIEAHSTNLNTIWVVSSSEVLKSTDGGITFSNITNNLPFESKRVIKHQPYSENNSLYLGTSLGVYYLDDLSETWSSFSGSLPNVAVTDLEINTEDSIITASTYGRGVWQSPIPLASKPTADIELYGVVSTSPNYTCDPENTMLIRVHNNGTNRITAFDIVYTLSTQNPETRPWTGTLLPGQTSEITLNNLGTLDAGENSLNINIVLPSGSDEYPENNTDTVSISEIIPQNTASETNDLKTFEVSGEDNWVVKGDQDVWSIAVPNGTVLNSAGSGSKAYTTNPNGNYASNKQAQLVSPCYDLTTVSSPVLKFSMAYQIEEDWDYLYLEYTINKGATWNNLATYTGNNATLSAYEFDLESFANASSIIFRYRFVTDTYVEEEGVVLDDFIIEGSTLNLEENIQNNINLYPNPSNGNLTVTWKPTSEASNIKIYNLLGHLILNQNINEGQQRLDLNMTKEASGIYFIKLKVGNRFMRKKLIITNH